jgi:hypothetical protein
MDDTPRRRVSREERILINQLFAQAAARDFPSPLAIGDRVRITGAKHPHDGKHGVIVRVSEGSEAWLILLDDNKSTAWVFAAAALERLPSN